MFLSGMVLAFLVLPGLDACPTDYETFAALNDHVGITPDGVTSVDSPAAFRAVSSTSQASAFDPPIEVESVPSQHSGGGSSTFEDHWEAGGQCFEGANFVGSVGAILQVSCALSAVCRLYVRSYGRMLHFILSISPPQLPSSMNRVETSRCSLGIL